MIAMMKMIPTPIRKKIPAPMISKEFRDRAKEFNTGIELNLDNLMVCGEFCGACPSKPSVSGEALFCATGKSSSVIEMNGCNCIECPLFDQCGNDSIGYFCKYGVKPLNKSTLSIQSNNDLAYLSRFTQKLLHPSSDPDVHEIQSPNLQENGINDNNDSSNIINLTYHGDDVEVRSSSNQTILDISLQNDIPHVHICGGKARCSTCRIIVLEGLNHCLPRNAKEAKLAGTKGFPAEVRLACQTKLNGSAKIRRLVFDELDSSEAIHEGKKGLNISGTEVDAAVLFSDIRSFTSFSEKNLPYDIIHILNRYFNTIGTSIDANGGYIDKYMGDGIMVTFGLEERNEHPAILALKSAKSMISALEEFNKYLKSHFDHEFQIGIGIHYGSVIVGNLGFQKKMEFTAIGDTVNTASRIESLNKKLRTKVLVSQEVYKFAKNEFKFSKGFRSAVKGKEEKLQVYVPDFGVIEEKSGL